MQARFGIGSVLLVFAGGCFAASGRPDIVYLNRCAANCAVAAGPDDAVNGKSSLLSHGALLAAFPQSDDTFIQTAACVRHALLPFNIHVVASNPGSVPRREVMLTTTADQIGLPSLVASTSPYDGTPHDNTIGFVFAGVFGSTAVDALCQETAQQIGFLYGIEYVQGNCADVEDNSTGCGEKSFSDTASNCLGGSTAGHCILGNTKQNSFAAIVASAAASDFIFTNGIEAFEVAHAGPSP